MEPRLPAYTVYMLETERGTLYVGQTSDLARRLIQHSGGSGKGSKYVRSCGGFRLVYRETVASRSEALRREAMIRRMTRTGKLTLIHRARQAEIIASIAGCVGNGTNTTSTITPPSDFVTDPRRTLTAVHIPDPRFVSFILSSVIEPMKRADPSAYFYDERSLHITVKNIRVVSDPPRFTPRDVVRAADALTSVIPGHPPYRVWFYRFIVFPNNIALMGTTDPHFDTVISDLDRKLSETGLADDKRYANTDHFFCNMTVARLYSPASAALTAAVDAVSRRIFPMEPYRIDSATLVTTNAAFTATTVHGQWRFAGTAR